MQRKGLNKCPALGLIITYLHGAHIFESWTCTLQKHSTKITKSFAYPRLPDYPQLPLPPYFFYLLVHFLISFGLRYSTLMVSTADKPALTDLL